MASFPHYRSRKLYRNGLRVTPTRVCSVSVTCLPALCPKGGHRAARSAIPHVYRLQSVRATVAPLGGFCGADTPLALVLTSAVPFGPGVSGASYFGRAGTAALGKVFKDQVPRPASLCGVGLPGALFVGTATLTEPQSVRRPAVAFFTVPVPIRAASMFKAPVPCLSTFRATLASESGFLVTVMTLMGGSPSPRWA